MGKTWTNRTKDHHKRKDRFYDEDIPEAQEYRQCYGKKKVFDSERAAKRFADEQIENGYFLRPYKCNFCKKYHLTSKDKK